MGGMTVPEFRCECGRSKHLGTDEWLKGLTLDQVRHAKTRADEIITRAEEASRRTVWVVNNGTYNDAFYREGEYEKAAEHLLRIFKEKFMPEAKDYSEKPYAPRRFAEEVPHIYPERVTQHEYDNEWFPEKKP
jgi:hypothetical protein